MVEPKETSAAPEPPLLQQERGWEIIPYIGVFFAGLMSAWSSIRTNFYQRAKDGYFRDIHKGRQREVMALVEKVGKGEISQDSFKASSAAIKMKYDDQWDKRLDFLGIHKGYGLRGTWDRFRNLNALDKAKSVAVGATVMFVGLGAMIGLHQRQVLEEKLDRVDRQKEQQSR